MKRKALYITAGILLAAGIVFLADRRHTVSAEQSPAPAAQKPATPTPPATPHRPKYVRGLHYTAWVTGSTKLRTNLDQLLKDTELNTVCIDIKEYEGEVYIPGYAKADAIKAYTPAMPEIGKYLADWKSRGIYTIARIVVFKDCILPKRRPELAVKTPEGNIWKDHAGRTWADPYNKEVWDYNIGLAEHALALGFDEIQFDYIRFPSDGNIKNCRYEQIHTSTSAAQALVGFLREAHSRLKPKGANISIDVFGLTTTVQHDMGIGQKMVAMTEWVDFVSPMVYPSHYNKGEYGIAEPNKAPYHTVYLGISGAVKRLGGHAPKLRPWLQDFSLGVRYGTKEVREQIQACYDAGIGDWLLWNPSCNYTKGALKGKEFSDVMEQKTPPEYITRISSRTASGMHKDKAGKKAKKADVAADKPAAEPAKAEDKPAAAPTVSGTATDAAVEKTTAPVSK